MIRKIKEFENGKIMFLGVVFIEVVEKKGNLDFLCDINVMGIDG